MPYEDGPYLAAEENLEGHGAWSETFHLIICKMNPNEIHAKHTCLYYLTLHTNHAKHHSREGNR